MRKKPKIMKGAEPFFYKGGSTGVLLLHGFTSSPFDMHPLGKYLAKKNFTVYAPLITGHGTTPEDLDASDVKQWVKSVRKAYKHLKKHCSNIYVAGSSTGSNLGFLALSRSRNVKGFVTLGMPLIFRGWLQRIFTLFDPFLPYVVPFIIRIKRFYKKDYPSSAMPLVKRKVHYKVFPIRKILDISAILKKTAKLLPKVKKPVLVMETATDHLLDRENGPAILKLLHSRKKRLVTIPDSYHVFIMDKHKRKAFKEIETFINSNSAS